MKTNKILFSVLVLAALAGCATDPQSATVYRSNEVGVTQNVRYATVQNVRPVVIDAGQSGVGLGTGAVIGGFAGSTLGGGSGRVLGGIVGAVAGGVAGQAIESNTSKKSGVELTLRLDNGQSLVVVQPDDGARFTPGARVRMIGNGSNTRVSY